MMILRGFTLSPYYDLGGAGCGKMTSSTRGANHFFPEKEKEDMLLDALIIPVFYFISTKCRCRNRM